GPERRGARRRRRVPAPQRRGEAAHGKGGAAADRGGVHLAPLPDAPGVHLPASPGGRQDPGPAALEPAVSRLSQLEERMDAVTTAGNPIPAQRYDFPDEDVETITRQLSELLRSRAFLTMGERCEEFERRFASFAGVPHAVAVSSGTAALEIILRA